MPARFDRLTLKLTLATVVFALLMSAAAGLFVTYGFRQAQQTATLRSAQGLEKQGRAALLGLTQREAQVSSAQFARAASAGRAAAQYLVDAARLGVSVPWDAAHHLSRMPAGQYLDPNPARRSDVFIPRSVAVGAAQQSDVRDSAALDAVFPALLAQVPDATAIYYMSPHSVLRYYPVNGVVQLMPPDYAIVSDPSSAYTGATPRSDPARATVWQAAHIDPEQTGVLVTAGTPIYDGGTFRGVIGIDVSLLSLINHLDALKPTPSGYAFLVDRTGRLIAAPPSALADLVGRDALPPALSITTMLGLSLANVPDAAFRRTLNAMRNDQQGIARLHLGGKAVYLSYAPLPGLGWSLGLVAPIDELVSQSAAVTSAIQGDANATIRATLIALGICFALILLATLLLSRRLLVRPIAALTAATQAVAAGDLSVTIPVTRRDEIGQLARSFNKMGTELRQSYESLEQRVQERTRELSTLLEVSHTVASTLELAPLLDLILDQLQSMVDYRSAAILMLDGDHLIMLEYRGAVQRDRIVGLRIALEESEPHAAVIRGRKPVIVADIKGETAVTAAYHRSSEGQRDDRFGPVHAWLGVPMIVKERTVGMLTAIHDEPGYYLPHHAQLATVIAAQAAVAIENARLYAQAQELAALKERSRLARELHDSVSQALYGIALAARTARTLLDRDPPRASDPLDYVLTLAEAGLAEMRALIFELRPESLEVEGLIAALDHQLAALHARHGIAVEVALGTEPDVPYAAKEAMYRVAQEALHNVVKHARAGAVKVTLGADAEGLTLVVCDDGQGFDVAGPFPGHLGMRTMQERAAALGGTVRIESTPGSGTRVHAWIPNLKES